MQHYKILILVNEDCVQAADTDDRGKTLPISINGNTSMNYKTTDDMDSLVTHIKDNYNIDEFSDDNFSVIIINCGGDRNAVQRLLQLTEGAADSNVINAEYVLPFIAAAKEKLRKEQSYKIRIGKTEFVLATDANGISSCIKSDGSEKDEADIILELKDFAALFSADISRLGNDEEALKQKDEELQQLSKEYEQKLADAVSKADSEMAKIKAQLDDAQKSLSKWTRRRSLCWSGNQEPRSSGGQSYYSFFGAGSGSSKSYRREITMLHKNGDSVKENEKIAEVKLFEGKATVNYAAKYYVRAEQDGKVFYLAKNTSDIWANTPIAIVADKKDTEEDAMEWFALAHGAIPQEVTHPVTSGKTQSDFGRAMTSFLSTFLSGIAGAGGESERTIDDILRDVAEQQKR